MEAVLPQGTEGQSRHLLGKSLDGKPPLTLSPRLAQHVTAQTFLGSDHPYHGGACRVFRRRQPMTPTHATDPPLRARLQRPACLPSTEDPCPSPLGVITVVCLSFPRFQCCHPCLVLTATGDSKAPMTHVTSAKKPPWQTEDAFYLHATDSPH